MAEEHYDSASEQLERAKATLTGVRVLVVDADAAARQAAVTAFQKAGAAVRVATDGGQAVLALYQAHETDEPIQLVVLSLNLPRLAGADVLELIRKDSALAPTGVIVATGVQDKPLLQRCAALGVAAVLVKPVMPQQILDAAVNAIAQSDASVAAEAPSTVAVEPEPGIDPVTSTLSARDWPLQFGGFPESPAYALRLSYLRCRFCQTIFTAPRLVNRALQADPDDHCAIGLYKGPLDKDFLEFLLIEMIVCPGCLFTQDRVGFDRFSRFGKLDFAQVAHASEDNWEAGVPAISGALAQGIAARGDHRRKMAQQAGDGGQALFQLSQADPTIPRAHRDALVSYDLALDCIAAMLKRCDGETAARVRLKGVGFMLKRRHCRLQWAAYDPGSVGPADLARQQIEELRQAFALLQSIKAVEFRVLEERLIHLTRGFFLADELLEHAADDKARAALKAQRQRAWTQLRSVSLEQQRARNERGANTARRFLDTLDRRMQQIAKGGTA